MRGCQPQPGAALTSQGVLRLPDALDDHPGLLLLEAGRALEVGPPVFQHVVVNLAVLVRHAPHQCHTVVCHQRLGQVDHRSAGHCPGQREGGMVEGRGRL